MKQLSKSEIVSADDLARQVVEVPEWGGAVTVVAWSGTQRDAFEAEYSNRPTAARLINVRARIVQRSIIDPTTGELMFTPKEVVELGAKCAIALNRVFEAACKLNGILDADIEELAGNSESSPGDDSSSD